MTDIEQKQTLLKCFHCGNDTLMNLRGKYLQSNNDPEDFHYMYEYEFYECPVCHNPTLYSLYSDESMIYYFRGEAINNSDNKIIYPVNQLTDKEYIPEKIKYAFEAALKVKTIDMHICLMALRRTLELILNDQGASDIWGLKRKIESTAQKGILPDTLKEASSLTKMLGDNATHDNPMEITQHDVNSMSEFVNFIIEYIYVIPKKILVFKENLKED